MVTCWVKGMKNLKWILVLVFAAAVALAAGMAGADTGSGTGEWVDFSKADAEESLPGLGFTVSHPSWFTRNGTLYGQNLVEGQDFRYYKIFVASGTDRETGDNFADIDLSIGMFWLGQDQVRKIRSSGIDCFGYGFFRGRLSFTLSVSTAVRTLTFKGRQAADVDFIERSVRDDGVVVATFHFRRLVLHDDMLFLLECASGYMPARSEQQFPSRSQPEIARNCVPFLDSLKISD
ncbi:MAG: hypothetical protein LBT40_06475 [Deltaproteobacteria bacterium]|jgi:hypothetical protein|nr:hypothetical protein [Deltaproteobacteria bacterium]